MELFVSDIHGNYDTFARILRNAPQDAHLHVVGDIFDRGPAPDKVMDALASWPNADIQWGNHDVLWMGAALGQPGSIANVVRICARYGNLDVLENNYGIDLEPLRGFAASEYANDPCVAFGLKGSPELSPEEEQITVKIQKAMAYIQFKVEHLLITENPSFGLARRDMLHRINYQDGTIRLNDRVYELKDKVFPTVDPVNPYTLTDAEVAVLEYLKHAFLNCEKLQAHMHTLIERGSLYKRADDILLFHACVPMTADGLLLQTGVFGKPLAGRALFDTIETEVHKAFTTENRAIKKRGGNILWYLWLGVASPLFAKSKMATFELYQLEDKALRTEIKNPFYNLLAEPQTAATIFGEFGMDPETSRIVVGHVPVKVKDGEDPVKCGGKLIDIDGGMSCAYQPSTGIGGFLLVKDEGGLRLGTLPRTSTAEAQHEGSLDVLATWRKL